MLSFRYWIKTIPVGCPLRHLPVITEYYGTGRTPEERMFTELVSIIQYYRDT